MPTTRTNQRWQQAAYLFSAVVGRLDPGRTRCPHCGDRRVTRISRKRIVTSLVQCQSCRLRFRIPQDTAEHAFRFYQHDYRSSLATECPSPDECRRMRERGFAKTEKDFSHRIEVAAALGMRPGARVLDYGASWGYGTWQFLAAGYDSVGYEISRPRAAYAREHLGVTVMDDAAALEGPFDCVFSCHVMEHLPSPGLAFELAQRVLKPGGLFMAFTPNGSEACRQADEDLYDSSWGRLHPLYLDDGFYRAQFHERPFLLCSAHYGEKYPLEVLRSWDRRQRVALDLSRRELLFATVY